MKCKNAYTLKTFLTPWFKFIKNIKHWVHPGHVQSVINVTVFK